MKTMHLKKLALTLLAGFIGGALSLVAFILIASHRQDIQTYKQQQVPAQLAAYSQGDPVTGPDFRVAAQKSVHAVVHIKTTYQQKSRYYDDFFSFDPFFDFFRNAPNNNYPLVAAGSGVIVSDNGYIVTNNHVVQNATSIEVTLNDKRTYNATVVGTDELTDLAVIKIDEKDLPYLTYGNSDMVQVGEWVLAVGNPFNLASTVTAGIVSAKARDIQILGDASAVESFIQTDAAVNPGNSGGALVNTTGELIGINAAIASNTGSYTGYSFAIPSNLVSKVVGDLIEFGEVQRAYMGISFKDIDGTFAREKGLAQLQGVYVESVIEEGSAQVAGIKAGDIILKVDDIPTNSKSELKEIIARHRPGDKILVTLTRNGQQQVVDVTLKNRIGATGIVKTDASDVSGLLGATLELAPKEELSALGLDHGIKITRLEQGKLMSAGIKQGFIITYIDQQPVSTVEDIVNILKNKTGGILIEGVYTNGMRAYYGFGL